MRASLLLAALLATTPLIAQAPAIAQQAGEAAPAPVKLTVDSIFGRGAVRSEGLRDSRWGEDGESYLALEDAPKGGQDIVRYRIQDGARTVVVPASALVPQGADKPLAIDGYSWSPDHRLLLIQTNSRPFRRTNALADHWLYDTATRALRKIGGDAAASSVLYASFSPDSRRIAYVHRNNLYVEPVEGGAPVQLTRDGDDYVVNGLADWVYEEEFSLHRAFAWSPDSKRIAFWRFDTRGVGTFFMIKNTAGQYSQPIPLQYPKAGTTNSAVTVGTVDVADGRTSWFELEGDPRQNYVPQLSWAGGADAVFLQQSNRLQNTYKVLLGDPATGAVKPIMVEHDAAWVEANAAPEWLKGGRSFTWLSERDGWRHLYTIDRATGRATLRTPGRFDVIDLLRVDEKAGYAWFIASPDNPTQRYLYRTTLSGAPKVERLTPAGQPGTHSYDIAPGAHWALHTVSRFDAPPVTDMLDLTRQTPLRTLVTNKPLARRIADTGLAPTEFFRVDIGGGTQLDGWLIKPAGFDPAKRYPILFYVYGEPWGQTVADHWQGSQGLWHRMLAQSGYLIASIDPRGTASPRGRDWRKSIYRQVGIQASADYAAAVRKLLADRPYIDPARIGIWGWSGGGAMTQNALFRYPELYKTGIAIAGPTDMRLYDTVYQERYMGLPEDNADGYRNGSPITFADRLQGNLLLIHGTGDDNVHYQNQEQLADRLIRANRQFTMMAYPDRTHGIYEGENTTIHLYTLMTRYLETNLPPGGR
ncbi:S9 family peptidase [Sphingomonas sp. ABOLD]|uniref:Dipeptidyl-peptidase-4 n=1 Tax=Sphingomonas trueperi TaxID=53317 RepID=A0A7X6BCR7_9SPHN|nr:MULTISPECIES: S9 family peptidase [Sphingomonas]NJB98374.1 dipeptidyl-peptidase-4 [Sphingomonas trueperi]RSV40733.1 S9 family peptidase [Sphingomonas sp. ABOLD]